MNPDSKPGYNSSPEDLTPKLPTLKSAETECEQAIEELFADFAAELERIAWAILRDWQLASDAVQESFALFAQKLVEIEEENRRGWLVKTVQFQSYNLRRKNRKLTTGIPSRWLNESIHSKWNHQTHVDLKDDIRQLEAVVSQLPKDQRLVVHKRLKEEKRFSDIAKELGLPLGTVLSRMRLALSTIRTKIQDE